MNLPSAPAIGKAVLMTAVSLVILKAVKPMLPASLQNLIPV